MSFLLAAITLGFLGSFHCVGMCGPIALALPVHSAPPFKKTMLVLSYNIGRMLTYSIFGLLAGLIGQTVVLAGYQQALSIVLGLLLLLMVFLPSNYKNNSVGSGIFGFFADIKNEFGKLFLKNGHGPLFLIGLLNGLLPCGLVYMGLAGAMSTGNALEGALFMAVFGFGTVPVMLALPLAGGFISVDARNRIRKTVPVIVTLTAVMLILRGLSLGIPYISPSIENPDAIACHTSVGSVGPKTIIKCIGPSSAHKK